MKEPEMGEETRHGGGEEIVWWSSGGVEAIYSGFTASRQMHQQTAPFSRHVHRNLAWDLDRRSISTAVSHILLFVLILVQCLHSTGSFSAKA